MAQDFFDNIMIPGFLNTVKQDYAFMGNSRNIESKDADLQQKVALTVVRLFASLGIFFSGVIAATTVTAMAAFGTFTATATLGASFVLTSAAVVYVVAHDIFVIARNKDQWILGKVAAQGRSFLKDVIDTAKGKKDPTIDALRRYYTEGTLLRPLWDTLIAEVETQKKA